MVNMNPESPHEGGFLALRYLEKGTKYSHVVKADVYAVESSLMGIRDWFGRLLLGIGFSPAPGEGYSWTDVVDRQVELVRYLDGLPPTERVVWKKWAARNFITHALERAQVPFKSRLTTSRPADEVVAEFLPDDAAFFSNISSRMEDAQPLVVIRRAFPTHFSSDFVTLPGTTSSSGAGTVSTTGIGAGGGEGPGNKDKRLRVKEKDGGDAPGSKAGLTKVLSGGQFFFAARVADLRAIAESFQLKVEDRCWPVLLSNKPGKAALALCPCPDKHGVLSSKIHQPPKGFNREKVFKKFFSAATAEQLTEAGWRNIKKSKI